MERPRIELRPRIPHSAQLEVRETFALDVNGLQRTSPVRLDKTKSRPSNSFGRVLLTIAHLRQVSVECVAFGDPLIEELLAVEAWAVDVLRQRYCRKRYGHPCSQTVRRFFEDFDNEGTYGHDLS